VEWPATRGKRRHQHRRRRRNENTQVSRHYQSHVSVNSIQQYYIRKANCDSNWRQVFSHHSLRLLTLTLDDNEDSDQENVFIKVPVPPAPRKSRPTKDSMARPIGNGHVKGKANGQSHSTLYRVTLINPPNRSGSMGDSSARGAGKDLKDVFVLSSSDGEDSDQEKHSSDGNSELNILRTNPKALKKFFINEVTMFLFIFSTENSCNIT
jgi:hypothetical protein